MRLRLVRWKRSETNRRRRILLIVDQWIVFWLLFRTPEYYDLLLRYREMATLLGDPRLLASFQLSVGHCQYVFGLLDQALETMTDSARLSDIAGAAENAGPVYCMLRWIHYFLGNFEQSLSFKAPAHLKSTHHFDLRWYAWSLAAASNTFVSLGRYDDALNEAQKELVLAAHYQDASFVSSSLFTISLAYTNKGDLVKAIEHAQLAVEKATTPADEVWAQTLLAWAWCRADRAREGADLLASLVPVCDATRFRPGQVFSRRFLGEAYWRAGQLLDAEQTLQAALAIAPSAGMKFEFGVARQMLGEVFLERNPEQVAEPLAAPHFKASIPVLHQIKAENELALAYAGYGRLHKQQGHVDEARDYFTRA
jgi:tetratricopeptide (TPR) repeat protein